MDKVTIVTACDNNYIMLLATLLKSIEVNNENQERIDFYIVEDKISEENRNKLEKSIKTDSINILWLKMSEVLPNEIDLPSDSSTYPLNIYVRLFIPHFIPQELKRVIFMDVDMVVLRDIGTLWKTNLKGEYVGAVQDTFGTAYYGIENHEELGIPADSKYFNAGFMLIDTFKWREDGITEKLLRCLKENKSYSKYNDQYALNVVLANRWFQLNPKWNTYTYETEENPYLIHYIGYKPIYHDYDGNQNYWNKFYYYLNLTEWKGYSPKSKYFRYLSKLKTKLTKLLN